MNDKVESGAGSMTKACAGPRAERVAGQLLRLRRTWRNRQQ